MCAPREDLHYRMAYLEFLLVLLWVAKAPTVQRTAKALQFFMDVPVDLRPLCYVGFVASRLKWIWVGLTRDPTSEAIYFHYITGKLSRADDS